MDNLLGSLVATDFPIAFSEFLKAGFALPQTWSMRATEALGSDVRLTLWSWPLDFLYGAGARMGLSFALLERMLGIFPIFLLGAYSIRRLMEHVGVKGAPRLVAVALYVLNTYLLLVVDGGQISIGLAYALLPLALVLFEKGVGGGIGQKVVGAGAVTVLGFLDIRYVYLLALLLATRLIYALVFSRMKVRIVGLWLLSGVITGAIFLGVNFYWLLPILATQGARVPESYGITIQPDLAAAQIKHALLLFQPHWYKNVFGEVAPIGREFILLPLLVVLAPFLEWKDKEMWYWICIAGLGVVLTAGTSQPLFNFYAWLYRYVPGFSLFRDSTKFYLFVVLGYSVLAGVAAQAVARRWPKLQFAYIAVVLVYLLVLSRPVWLGKMTGMLAPARETETYLTLAEKINADTAFGRILWVPARPPLGFSSLQHPSTEAVYVYGRRPFVTGNVGSYELYNFLRESDYTGEVLGILGFRYVIYPYPDTRRQQLDTKQNAYFFAFRDQLAHSSWVKRVETFGGAGAPVTLYETKRPQDHFFLANSTWLVVGSDDLYHQLVGVPGFNLARNALVFAESDPGQMAQLRARNDISVINYNKGDIDLIASLIDPSRFLFPATELASAPDGTGWWKRTSADFLWLRDFIQQKYGIDFSDFDYGGGNAIMEGNGSLELRQKGRGVLFVRILRSSRGGKVGVYQGDVKIGEVNTKITQPAKVRIKTTGYREVPDKYTEYTRADFSWFKVGTVSRDLAITLRAEGDINMVNAMAYVDEAEFAGLSEYVHQLKADGRVVVWGDLTDAQKQNLFVDQPVGQVSYTRFAPTHYKVNVSGLVHPGTLIFAETYDPLWRANEKGPFKAYGLVNGYLIDRNGDYDIYFAPQRYIPPGLAVSGSVLIFSIIIAVWSKYHNFFKRKLFATRQLPS